MDLTDREKRWLIAWGKAFDANCERLSNLPRTVRGSFARTPDSIEVGESVGFAPAETHDIQRNLAAKGLMESSGLGDGEFYLNSHGREVMRQVRRDAEAIGKFRSLCSLAFKHVGSQVLNAAWSAVTAAIVALVMSYLASRYQWFKGP